MYIIFHRAITFTHIAHVYVVLKMSCKCVISKTMCCPIYPECVPKRLTNRLSYWKAEELHKLAYPTSECVLGKNFHLSLYV